MLTNDYGQKWTKRFKQNFFNTQMSLMSNRLQLPFFVHYGVAIIMFWFNMSIFFVNDPLTPQIFNDLFKMVLLNQFAERTSIPLEIFRIQMIVINLQLIVLYIIHFRSNFMNNSLTKYLNLLIFIYMTAIVPTTHLTIYSLKNIDQSTETSTIVINVSLAIVSSICNLIVGAFTYFKVRPFRKKSVFWSLDNSKQFYWYVLNFVRVLVIMLDDRTVSFLIISFVIEIFLRQSVNNYFTKEDKKVHSFLSNLVLSVHLALLVKDFTSSPDLATQILCFLLLVTIVSGALSCYSLMHQQRYFPLCNSPIWEYYDFYFHFVGKKLKGNNKSKMSMKKDSDSDKILSIHALNCQEKGCKIKNFKFSQDTYCQDLQNLSSETMLAKCNDSELNELINELWKFETGNKYKFRMQSKNIPLIYEYVIYCVLNLSRLNQKSDSVNQENIKSLKNIFFDKLQNCLECFSLFYQEITKTQPKIDTILCVGNDIKKRAEDLKTLYSELLKHNVINFKTAQVYVEFENYFLKENNVNQESIDRLRKIQKSREADHIEEIYLPTLTSYAESGLIENMNTECLSFFKLTRFEMKSKSFGSLLFPQVNSIAQIKQRLKTNKNQKMCTFFKRRNEIVYGSICIKEKYIENKKFDVVTIQKNAYSDYKNVLLIKKDTLAIEALEKEETYIRPNINFSNHLTLRWRYLYDNYLQQKIEELTNEKIVKVRIEELENSLFVMNVEESLHEEYYVVNIKVIKEIEKKRNRVSSFMINKPQVSAPRAGIFHFFYDLKDSKSELYLYGVNSDQFTHACSLKKNETLGIFEKDLNNMLVANTLLQENRYTRGIKTYRLWEKELYNIDLEDKDKQVEQFDDKISNSTDKPTGQVSETDFYIMTGIFSILVILVGLSLGYNSIATSLHDDVVTCYSNGLKIEQLRLHMNRIVSITRDIEFNRYEKFPILDWKSDLLTSYTNLKQLRYQSLLFESELIVVNYRNINYTGTLNEIIDVMISHVYEMTLGTPNLTEINYFHQSYISDVNARIINERNKLSEKISDTAKNFKNLQEILLIVGVICIFIFYLLLGLLIVVLNTSAKKKLENLMMMSDSQARMNQTMAEKLKYAVDMIKKNFDFDLKTVIGPPEKHKQRKKSKQVIIGIQKKIIIVLSLIVGFVVHFVIYYNFTNEISTVLSTINVYQDQGKSLMDVYSGFSELTNKIEHLNQYDQNKFAALRQRLGFLTGNRMNFEFNTETNSFIDSIFYENSCKTSYSSQIFKGQPVTCDNALPQFMVNNPYQIGLLPYFVKANYNIIDNITQTYGCTGLYSSPFIKVFSLLAEKIRKCGLDFIEGSFKQFSLYNLIYSIMSLLYAFITLMVIYVLKGTNKEIDELLKFLNYNEKLSSKKKKKEDKQKEENTKEISSSSVNSEKNDNSEHDVSQKTIKKDLKKRNESID